MAVESERDAPLDLGANWQFYRKTGVYLQHQCHYKVAQKLAGSAERLLLYALSVFRRPTPLPPLQIRLFDTPLSYRQALRFSAKRNAHYNPRHLLVTTHCQIAEKEFLEQVGLFYFDGSGLRTWQRILLAEALPLLKEGKPVEIQAAKGSKPAPLLHLLLSDHPLNGGERAALSAFVRYLNHKQKLEEFLRKLYYHNGDDDTGLDILEQLFPKSSERLLHHGDLGFYEKNSALGVKEVERHSPPK
ncbi:MAG: hypothetical protein N2Z22_03835 [Turneriella sp.]|nr:hypothetical protein [Turneriella sp.]